MFSLEITLLGMALAVDAAVVTFAIGLLCLSLSKTEKAKRALVACFIFGFFQFIMLWMGSYFGYLFSFSQYGYLFRFIVGLIFIFLAFKVFMESLKDEKQELEWRISPILILAFATSVDALAAGISLGTLPSAYLAAAEVGFITFCVCLGFYLMSQVFRQIPERWLLRLAALIFIVLGGEVFVSFFAKGLL